MWSEVLSAGIAGLATIAVAILAHRRANRAIRMERKELADKDQARQLSEQRKQTESITNAYESVLAQLRDEVDRLIRLRTEEHVRWQEQESELRRRIDLLETALREETEHRVKVESRLEAVEAELAAVEKRAGWRNDHEPDDDGTLGSDSSH